MRLFAVFSPGFDAQDAAWTQDFSGADTAVEEWQWVEDPASGGYYYNTVTVRLIDKTYRGNLRKFPPQMPSAKVPPEF